MMPVDMMPHQPSLSLVLLQALLLNLQELLLLVILEGEAIPSLIILNRENNKNQKTRQKDKKLNAILKTPRNRNLRKILPNFFK